MRYPDYFLARAQEQACTICMTKYNLTSNPVCDTKHVKYQIDNQIRPSQTSSIRVDNYLVFEIYDTKIAIGYLKKRKSLDEIDLINEIESNIHRWVC